MTTIAQLNRTIISTVNGSPGSDLVVRFPGSADRNALSQLGRQVDQPVPTGSVMLAEQAGRVIAAVSLDGGAALAEPTPEAESAVAVLRFRIHQLRHGAFGAGVTGHRRTMAAA